MAQTIAISKKNQITIPQAVVDKLGFKDRAEYIVSGGQFILKPARDDTGDYFSEEILADLIDHIPAAVQLMIEDAEEKAVEISEEELWGDV